MTDDQDQGAGVDVNDIVVASIIAQGGAAPTTKPVPAEPYVEPDYGVVWRRRWRLIRATLLVIALLLTAALVIFARSG